MGKNMGFFKLVQLVGWPLRNSSHSQGNRESQGAGKVQRREEEEQRVGEATVQKQTKEKSAKIQQKGAEFCLLPL